MKKILVSIMVLIASLSTSLSAQENHRLGGDRDEHGCIGSAGYQWCELLKKCIRIFEDGVKLSNELDKNSTSASYAVFNADKSKVQLFLPGLEGETIILNKKRGKVWKNQAFKLYMKNGILRLKSNGKVIYQQTEISVSGNINSF